MKKVLTGILATLGVVGVFLGISALFYYSERFGKKGVIWDSFDEKNVLENPN